MRTDGFVSVRALYEGVSLLTRPLRFQGRELSINYSTSAAGSVQVEIQDASGKAISGYGVEDCPEIVGDEIERVISWKGGSDVSQLADRAIRLRFALRDGDLFPTLSMRIGLEAGSRALTWPQETGLVSSYTTQARKRTPPDSTRSFHTEPVG